MSTTLARTEDDDHALAMRPAGNPFQAPAKREAAVEVETSRAIAEVQAAMVIAQRFPRDQVAALDRIKNACSRPGLAAKAMYSYARGGTEITGPSIRLAEAMAQNWGNMQWGTRELEQRPGVNGRVGESTVESFAWDVETNSKATKLFQQPHVRDTKQGQKKLTDQRDVYELIANNGARRVRACILAVIPIDVQEDAIRWCEETLTTNVKVTKERIDGILREFGALGVSRKAIETRIQRRIEAITPMLVVNLVKIYNSINDGMSAPGDWFEIEPAAVAGGTAAAVNDKLGKKVAETAQQTAPVEPPVDSPAEEPDESKRLAAMSAGDLTKYIKAEAARLEFNDEELEDIVADTGGWKKSNAAATLAKMREIAERRAS
jgi:hypothetical protein